MAQPCLGPRSGSWRWLTGAVAVGGGGLRRRLGLGGGVLVAGPERWHTGGWAAAGGWLGAPVGSRRMARRASGEPADCWPVPLDRGDGGGFLRRNPSVTRAGGSNRARLTHHGQKEWVRISLAPMGILVCSS
jgi:hypothetical protein